MQNQIKTMFSSLVKFFISLPSMVVAGICPICWSAYAGILSALGVSLTLYIKYLFPITIVLLMLALAALGFKAKQRRGFKPFILGFIAAFLIISGKFIWPMDGTLYIGILLLISASIWNVLPKRKT
ncbi:MAG: hypothetical protein BGO90_12265 [Legionella sp. 40-6]|nr:hypothetical protein [Legionella sp.]OJY43979.1 MAG: hypothetical protein BGO90_12265 [Legionella sp. 40-6]